MLPNLGDSELIWSTTAEPADYDTLQKQYTAVTGVKPLSLSRI
jgi:hypothetical protein